MVDSERNLLRDLQLINNLLFADYACYKKITQKKTDQIRGYKTHQKASKLLTEIN